MEDQRTPLHSALLALGKHLHFAHKNIVIDVQITNTCSDPNLERRPGAAAKQSETRKNTKYASSVKQLGAEYYAFSVEVQGRYGEQALKLFNYLAQQLS